MNTQIATALLVYAVLAIIASNGVGRRWPNTWFTRLIEVFSIPAGILLLPLLMLACIPATFFFWLYPERHQTSIDRNGTEAEKAALAALRRERSTETLLQRLFVKMHITQPRIENQEVLNGMEAAWESYSQRHERGKKVANKKAKNPD